MLPNEEKTLRLALEDAMFRRARQKFTTLCAPALVVTLVAATSLSFASCGKESGSGSSGASEQLIPVTATISDWAGQNNPFQDYVFALFDIDQTQIFRSVVGEGGRVTIDNVPNLKKYYGFMLDTEFRFGWVLQFSSVVQEVTKSFQVFSFLGGGSLGSLFPEGRIVRTSSANLSPATEFTFLDANNNGVPDGFDLDVANNENAEANNTTNDLDRDKILDPVDPDIDNDGVPNVFDGDVDNNGVDDLYDTDVNHDNLDDQQKPIYVANSAGVGFKHVFHEIVTNSDDSTSTNLWFILESKTPVSAVTVTSGTFLEDSTFVGAEAFDGRLYDDGTHGDGLPADGIWSAHVTLASGKTFGPSQVVVFSVVGADGKQSEFVYKFPVKLSGNVSMTSCQKANNNVTLSWTVDATLTSHAGLSLQTVVSDSDGKRVYTSTRMPISTTTETISASNFVTGKQYTCTVRVLAPSPIPGYPGSSLRAKPVSYSATSN